jgi:SMC interacting uncharacterized protein involved in chromosome segregation
LQSKLEDHEDEMKILEKEIDELRQRVSEKQIEIETIKKAKYDADRLFAFDVDSFEFYSDWISDNIMGNQEGSKYKKISDYIKHVYNKQYKKYRKTILK